MGLAPVFLGVVVQTSGPRCFCSRVDKIAVVNVQRKAGTAMCSDLLWLTINFCRIVVYAEMQLREEGERDED